ncbi:MAG: methyltransferase domain-containing protein [Anaerolineae bacterium]|jgi:23S rRNA G2445 N2-methylase RlmL|nr:methyltransferase domain-containing protein [Anaerolineae bacterium]
MSISSPIPLFAICTRGLEAVSAQEITALAGCRVQHSEYRRVRFSCAAEHLPDLFQLRTVDDVFFHLADWNGIYHTRVALTRINQLSQALRIHPLLSYYANFGRTIPASPVFSVTANFVGRRKYSTEEIKQAVASGVQEYYRWAYSERFDDSDLNLRLFLEHEFAVMGLRLSPTPLHRRPYKQEHLPGSLKPTVAAALAVLGEVKSGQTVLDPFCGAGTILTEAAGLGASIIGGDMDPAAVQASRTNLQAAGVTGEIHQWDAQELPLEDDSVDVILSNPPWGGQVQAGNLNTLYTNACAEMRRVLKPGGRIVLLTESDFSKKKYFGEWNPAVQFEVSVFGRNPVITIWQ